MDSNSEVNPFVSCELWFMSEKRFICPLCPETWRTNRMNRKKEFRVTDRLTTVGLLGLGLTGSLSWKVHRLPIMKRRISL